MKRSSRPQRKKSELPPKKKDSFGFRFPNPLRIRNERIVAEVNRVLERRFPEVLKDQRNDSIPHFPELRKNRKNVFVSEGTTVLKLGCIQVGTVSLPLVLKVKRLPIRKKYTNAEKEAEEARVVENERLRHAHHSELLSHLYRKRRLPAPFAMAMPVGKKGVYGVLTEDLAWGGRTLKEIDGFDFGELTNGQQLKKELEGMVERVKKMERDREIEYVRHVDPSDPYAHIRKCFFIQVNPKTRQGKIIMGDLDQHEISVWEEFRPHFKKSMDRLYFYKKGTKN